MAFRRKALCNCESAHELNGDNAFSHTQVNFSNGTNAVIPDDQIKGTLRVSC